MSRFGKGKPDPLEPDPFASVPDVDERLADYVDGMMSARDRERFEAEMRVSPQLREQVAEYEQTVASIRDALNAETHETNLADRVMESLAQQANGAGRRPRSGWPLVWAITSAAALLGIAVLVDAWGGTVLTPKTENGTAAHTVDPSRASSPGGDALAPEAGLPNTDEKGEGPVEGSPKNDRRTEPATEAGRPFDSGRAGAGSVDLEQEQAKLEKRNDLRHAEGSRAAEGNGAAGNGAAGNGAAGEGAANAELQEEALGVGGGAGGVAGRRGQVGADPAVRADVDKNVEGKSAVERAQEAEEIAEGLERVADQKAGDRKKGDQKNGERQLAEKQRSELGAENEGPAGGNPAPNAAPRKSADAGKKAEGNKSADDPIRRMKRRQGSVAQPKSANPKPANPRPSTPRSVGPATPGPSGPGGPVPSGPVPSGPVPSGPATGGPAGPSSPPPAGPGSRGRVGAGPTGAPPRPTAGGRGGNYRAGGRVGRPATKPDAQAGLAGGAGQPRMRKAPGAKDSHEAESAKPKVSPSPEASEVPKASELPKAWRGPSDTVPVAPGAKKAAEEARDRGLRQPAVTGPAYMMRLAADEDADKGEVLPLVTVDGLAVQFDFPEALKKMRKDRARSDGAPDGGGRAEGKPKVQTGSDDFYLGSTRTRRDSPLRAFFDSQMRPAAGWQDMLREVDKRARATFEATQDRVVTIGGLRLVRVGPPAGDDVDGAAVPNEQQRQRRSRGAPEKPGSDLPGSDLPGSERAGSEKRAGGDAARFAIPGEFDANGGGVEQRDWLVVGPRSEVAKLLLQLRAYSESVDTRKLGSGEVRLADARPADGVTADGVAGDRQRDAEKPVSAELEGVPAETKKSKSPTGVPEQGQPRTGAASEPQQRVVIRFRVRR